AIAQIVPSADGADVQMELRGARATASGLSPGEFTATRPRLITVLQRIMPKLCSDLMNVVGDRGQNSSADRSKPLV
ncbi:jg4236, partial [Pararge aegeria aegeria]